MLSASTHSNKSSLPRFSMIVWKLVRRKQASIRVQRFAHCTKWVDEHRIVSELLFGRGVYQAWRLCHQSQENISWIFYYYYTDERAAIFSQALFKGCFANQLGLSSAKTSITTESRSGGKKCPKVVLTLTHVHTHTHTHTHARTHTHINTHTHTHARSLARSLARTHARTLARTHAHTHTHTRTHTYTHTHKQRAHARMHTHTHTHTHTQDHAHT